MDVLGDRPDAFLGEAPEGVTDELEVAVQVPGPFLAGQSGQERGVAVAGHKIGGGGEGVRLRSPPPFTADDLGHQVPDGIGDKGARDAGLGLALLPVVQDCPRGTGGRGGMSEVVGDDLVRIDPAEGGD